MEEKNKHKVMIGIEAVLLCMLVAILGTNAASSNPPSNGVSYGGNNQTTVEGALNDLYNKANYGNASAGDILSGKTALIGGTKVTGTMPIRSGSSQAIHVGANNENTYLVFPYGYYPAENHFSQNNTSEVYIPNSQIASAIGLTANKIVKGQTVLGITGTGTTGYSSCSSCCPSCPSCPSSPSCPEWKVQWINSRASCSECGVSTSSSGEKKYTYYYDLGVSPSSVNKFLFSISIGNGTTVGASIKVGTKEVHIYRLPVQYEGSSVSVNTDAVVVYGSISGNRLKVELIFRGSATFRGNSDVWAEGMIMYK